MFFLTGLVPLGCVCVCVLVQIFCIPHLSYKRLSSDSAVYHFQFVLPVGNYLSKTHYVYISPLFQGALETLWSVSIYLLSQILWLNQARLLSVPLTALGSLLECANHHILLLIFIVYGVSFLRTQTVFWVSLVLNIISGKYYESNKTINAIEIK